MKRKMLQIESCRLKFDDDTRTFEGYASQFDGVDSYGDTIKKGAYEKTLKDRDRPIRMRFNHFGPVIGKWMEIREDEKGLFVRGQLTPGHRVAEDVYASMKHGAIDGMSIGYVVDLDEEGAAVKNENGGYDLSEIHLIEISVVEEPADLGATVSAVKEWKADLEQVESLKEVETYLREAAGFSRSAATALVSRVKTLAQGDPAAKTNESDSRSGAKLSWPVYRAMILKS